MPRPGSHKYDIRRARLRNQLDDHGYPDEQADRLANEILQNPGSAKARLLRVARKFARRPGHRGA